MRIYYLSDSTVPSSRANSVQVMKMCQAFAQNGHTVVLFAYKGDRNENGIYEHYDVTRCFEISGIPGSSIPGIRRLRRMYAARLSPKLQSLPDIFYGRDPYSLLSVASLGVPLIFEAHTPAETRMEKYFVGRLLSIRTLARLVVVSQALACEYLSAYPWFSEARVLVAHDGADVPRCTDNLDSRIAWPGRKGVLQLGYVGSLYPGKGAEIVAELASRLPKYDFHIVGGDKKGTEKIQKRFTGSNLFMHGHVEHAYVYNYLRNIDIGLLPCQEKVVISGGINIGYWMSPLKLFEYMASESSIIGSNLPVITEVLTHKVNSILVPPNKLECWMEAIEVLAKDDSFRKTIAARAYSDFTLRYTWAKRSELVLKGIKTTERRGMP